MMYIFIRIFLCFIILPINFSQASEERSALDECCPIQFESPDRAFNTAVTQMGIGQTKSEKVAALCNAFKATRDSTWGTLKQSIKTAIEKDEIHPDDIKVPIMNFYTIYAAAAEYRDSSFLQYLLAKREKL